jgi:hypothetical protein
MGKDMKTLSIVLSDDEFEKLEKMAIENFMEIDEYLQEKIKELLGNLGSDFLSQ